jgi:hypothetical protein
MSKQIRKYGIEATYINGGKAMVWYFTESHRNRMIFEMKRMPEIVKLKPKNRK